MAKPPDDMPEHMTREELIQTMEAIVEMAHMIHLRMVAINRTGAAIMSQMPRSFDYAAHHLRMAIQNARNEIFYLQGKNPEQTDIKADPNNEVSLELQRKRNG